MCEFKKLSAIGLFELASAWAASSWYRDRNESDVRESFFGIYIFSI